MKRFSERFGHEPTSTMVQLDGMANPLRNRLWNLFSTYLLPKQNQGHLLRVHKTANTVCQSLWRRFFKEPIDEIPGSFDAAYEAVKSRFYGIEWHRVYDLFEFILQDVDSGNSENRKMFCTNLNIILLEERSGYRLVDEIFVRIVDDHEIEEIENALESPLGESRVHIRTAISLISNREHPDYRNSIKESISAVEAAVKHVSGSEQGTLGKELRKLEKEQKIPQSLSDSFARLYSYTSDADGIRHALMKEAKVGEAEARFMVVACSAFINYLVSRESDDSAGRP